MTSHSFRDVPEPNLAALQERAVAPHRSVQSEACMTFQRAATEPSSAAAFDPMSLITATNCSDSTRSESTWSPEEIYGDVAR